MTDTLVKVDNVSKKFCRSLKRSLWYGMQDLGSELVGRQHGGKGDLRPDEFWALKDVSFELKRGECLGLIGRNGAGKTTLLRILNGLIKPDAGRVELRGRIGALIALGAGFNPILTGRENIYVNAAVLGLKRKDINAKFDEIVEFAELAEFIDAPVQTYSSGMTVRLGFSVAAHMEPDILLIDEVLAVGDAQFHAKCVNTIRQLQNNGVGTILVSHNMTNILRYSTSGIYLDKGRIKDKGSIEDVSSSYMSDQSLTTSPPPMSKTVAIDSGLTFGGAYVTDLYGNHLDQVSPHESLLLHIPYDLTASFSPFEVEIQLGIDDAFGVFYQGISGPITFSGGKKGDSGEFIATIERLAAVTGRLSVGVALWAFPKGTMIAWTRENYIHVTAPKATSGRVSLDIVWTTQ